MTVNRVYPVNQPRRAIFINFMSAKSSAAMNDFSKPVMLGRTGMMAGRLGIASSYGAPAAAYEEAFERGCNYFSVGTFLRGRSTEMIEAIRNITATGYRDRLIISLAEYTHSRWPGRSHFLAGLKKLGVDYVDVLMLGYYPRRPRRAVLDLAMELKEKQLVRFVSLSGHHRRLFQELTDDGLIDIFHLRYNAVNRGAETDVFPYLVKEGGPGIVAFTATRWGQLLQQKRMPPGEQPLEARDCYRFVLSHPAVDVCMTGTRSLEMMRENLATLGSGPLSEEEMARIRRIGDHIYGKPRQ